MNAGAPVDVAAVVLAAGASTRMGRAKLHLPWGATTILGRVLATLREAGLDRLVVVARTGDEAAARTAEVEGASVAWMDGTGDDEAGDCPTPSLQAALAHLAGGATRVHHHWTRSGLPPECGTRRFCSGGVLARPLAPPGAVLVMPGDLPLLLPETVALLIAAFRVAADGPLAIVVPTFEGRRGHPVIFGAAQIGALAALPPGRWPRDVVRSAGACVREVAVDDAGVATDIDDTSSYVRLRPPLA